MKKLVVVLVLMVLSTPAFATVKTVNNITNVTKVTEKDNNNFDYGAYLDAILYETKNSEWGLHSTYAYQDNEFRIYGGGKIYLGRMTYQKK